jgi:hypothetical protein
LHAGSAVINGTKIGLNIWTRERAYRNQWSNIESAQIAFVKWGTNHFQFLTLQMEVLRW